MALAFFLFPVIELVMIFKIGALIGVVNTLFCFLASGVLGFGIVKAQGRFLLTGFQTSLQKGEVPANQALHSALIFLGGLGLIVPGFLSDVVGILFILPGPRHLIALYLKKTLERKLKNGSFRVFGNFGNMGPFGPQTRPQEPGQWRDVSPREVQGEVIDVDFTSTSRPTSNNPTDDDSN